MSESFVFHSNERIEICLSDYKDFLNSLDQCFPGNPEFLIFAKAWLERAQAYARAKGRILVCPSIVANTKEGNGIVFAWESNFGIPINYHDYGFFSDGKAGYYNRNYTNIIDYSDPNAWFDAQFIPFANTVDMFSVPFEMAKLNNAA